MSSAGQEMRKIARPATCEKWTYITNYWMNDVFLLHWQWQGKKSATWKYNSYRNPLKANVGNYDLIRGKENADRWTRKTKNEGCSYGEAKTISGVNRLLMTPPSLQQQQKLQGGAVLGRTSLHASRAVIILISSCLNVNRGPNWALQHRCVCSISVPHVFLSSSGMPALQKSVYVWLSVHQLVFSRMLINEVWSASAQMSKLNQRHHRIMSRS